MVMMTLTSEVRRTLEHLNDNPHAAPYKPRELPQSLARDVQRHFMKLVRTRWDEIDATWTRHLALFSPSQPRLRDLYGALLDIGVDDDDVIRRLLLWALEARVMGIPEHSTISDLGMLGQPDRAILDLAWRMGDLSSDADYVFSYALGNHLCYYSESEWHLTGLGRTFLRLSSLQATRFLLSLEVFLHASRSDGLHMSREFLEAFLRTDGEPFAAIRTNTANRHNSQHDSWVDYHNRLREFGIAASFVERDMPQVTNVGRQIVGSVLDRDSAFDALIPLYVREDIVGIRLSDFSSGEDTARFRAILDKSRLVGELREPILDEIERLRQTDAAYLSVFKGLNPCIEGVLRNLAVAEHVVVSGSGLAAYVKAFEKVDPPILKPGTLQMIDAVFRPYRNIVEHGHVIASEPARMLCEISLSVIEQILKDYMEFSCQ